MSATITGIVTNGVIVPNSPLPEGARVEVTIVPDKPAPQTGSPLEGLQPSASRGVPAAQMRGIAAGPGVAPDDETIKRWIEEHRLEKYG